MAKTKQAAQEVPQEETFLFAIGTPEGDLMLKVGEDGNIMYLKEGVSTQEAARALWNSFQMFLPILEEEVMEHSNDAELGAYVRAKMISKLQNR